MIKNGIPNIIGIGALQRKASEVIEKIEKSGKEEDEILEIVAHGNREYKEGITIKGKTLKALMKQHGDR